MLAAPAQRIGGGEHREREHGRSCVSAVAVLLAVLGSVGWVAATETVFGAVPCFVGLTTTVTVTVSAGPMLPSWHVTVLCRWAQLPWLELAERNRMFLSRKSVRVTPDAICGPLFFTVNV